MALKKLQIKPGINNEITRYSAEGQWYECDKVRFRGGYPEKIGGWQRISNNTYLGVCRSLYSWAALSGLIYRGVGTNIKFYVEASGVYYDVTPVRYTSTPGDVTFDITSGSPTLTVNDVNHGTTAGSYVSFVGAETLGTSNVTADVLNAEHIVASVIDDSTYTITLEFNANQTVSGGGGVNASGEYQFNIGNEINVPTAGWGAGPWNAAGSTWGNTGSFDQLTSARLWSQDSFGEDLVFCYRVGPLAYWDSSAGTSSRAVLVRDLPGANEVPIAQLFTLVSDSSRFVFAFGTNEVFSTEFDPMLVRWSDQENITEWEPRATNQAGGIRLSKGSEIKAVAQSRQEILVWTDTSLYSFQFVGAGAGWAPQLIGDNVTLASPNAHVYANAMSFWMGDNQFYMYDGRVRDLPCTLRRYVFGDLNTDQLDQVTAAHNAEFHEVWWFYPSSGSTTNDRYVLFNYLSNEWAHGTLARTAWDGQRAPVAATYSSNLVQHEVGYDDRETASVVPITAYIVCAPMDIGDGDRFSFMWRMLPDVTFEGSTTPTPDMQVTVYGMKSSGSGYQVPGSQGGVDNGVVSKEVVAGIEQFTDQLNIRIRARMLAMRFESTGTGVYWQLGSPRIDVRTSGQRG